jgi:hypothetical protein
MESAESVPANRSSQCPPHDPLSVQSFYRHRKAAADRWEGLALMSVFRCTLASVDLLEPTLADIDSPRSAIHRIN